MMNVYGAIHGTLTPSDTLTGTLTSVSTLQGSLSANGNLAGELSTEVTLTGTLASASSISGILSIPTAFVDVYSGDYEVTPLAYYAQTLETENKLMEQDVTILAVPYYETSNLTGDTVYIASEV